MTINLDEGRRYFPSSESDNLVDHLRQGRIQPLNKYSQQEVINNVGSVSLHSDNQVVQQDAMNFLNPNVNGNTRHKKLVPEKRRIVSKYENRLRDDSKNIEALYDIRSNASRTVYGTTLNNIIDERAKSKVFNKPSINYLFQDASSEPYTSSQFKDYRPVMNQRFDVDFSSSDDGLLKFNVNSTGYNPMLMKDQYNHIDNTLTPNHPDERMSRYSGERTYITSGDRQLEARRLATSEEATRKRQLQNAAHDALTGTVHNERNYVPMFGKGVNVRYVSNDDSKETSLETVKVDRHEDSKEDYIPRESILKSVDTEGLINYNTISQSTKSQLEPLIKVESTKLFNKDVQRKIHKDSSDDYKLLGNPIIESFANTTRTPINTTHNKSVTVFDPRINEVPVNNTFIGVVKSTLMNMLTVPINQHKSSLMNSRSTSKMDTDVSYYYNNAIESTLKESYRKRLIDDYVLVSLHNNMLTDEYIEDASKSIATKTPMSIIRSNSNTIRTVITNDTVNKSVNVIQRIDSLLDSDSSSEYLITTIPIEVFNKIVNEDSYNDPKKVLNKRVIPLSYEDHIKVNALIQHLPDSIKYSSKHPITTYQRDLLDDNNVVERVLVNKSLIEDTNKNRVNSHGNEYDNRIVNSTINQKPLESSMDLHKSSLETSSRDHHMKTFNKDTDHRHITSRFTVN